MMLAEKQEEAEEEEKEEEEEEDTGSKPWLNQGAGARGPTHRVVRVKLGGEEARRFLELTSRRSTWPRPACLSPGGARH